MCAHRFAIIGGLGQIDWFFFRRHRSDAICFGFARWIWKFCSMASDLLVGQRWSRQWLVAYCHQAITWTNGDLSSARSSDIHSRTVSQEIPQSSINKISLKINYLRFGHISPRGQWVNSFSSWKICERVHKYWSFNVVAKKTGNTEGISK